MKSERTIFLWWSSILILLAFGIGGTAKAQDAGVEAGFEDDVTIRGSGGSRTDPDLEVYGYAAFGTNYAAAAFVTSGVGQVFIQRNLEVGSNIYARSSIVFSDGSAQNTAYSTNRIHMLASGECDTNRLDILFSSNYLVSTLRVWQATATGQAVSVFLNGGSVTTFPFTTTSTTIPLSINLNSFDRLGILCTNVSSTVLFAFEGRAR